MAHTKRTVAYNGNVSGQANTYSYSGYFDVFKGTEVKVTLDGVALTHQPSTINESASPREYTVNTTDKTIHIGGGDLSSGSIIIRPETDLVGEDAPSPKATYTPGASIAAADLNNNQKQLMRKALEYDDTKMSSTGDTMTGHLTMGEDQTIIFEGATDNGYETTLTVTDPTADRTITLPNVTGTVITTGDSLTVTNGMIANDAINGAKIGDDAIDSEHYAAGSIDEEHIANLQVTTGKIANDAIDGTKIADDAVDSEHIAADSLDTEHYAPNSVDADALAHTSVSAGSYSAADITVDAQGRITAANSGTISSGELGGDVIDGSKLADEAVDSEHYVDGSIDNEHLANNAVDTEELADNAVTIAKIGCEQTTISDSDSHVPTSGAVVDYVAAQIAPIGGLEVIADDESFPETQPASGVVISIADAGGLVVNGSGVSTTGDTISSDATVTINNINSSFHSTTIDAGIGMLVTSTGSGQIYNYHKTVIKESDVAQISDDINDFNSRYRIASSAPGSANDEGDLYFNTSTNKMNVYDGSSWGEVTSTGEFKILGIKDNGQAHDGSLTFNGSNDQFDLFEGTSDANITQASQLIISLNGVIQKPNDGSWSGSEEGFYLDGVDGIRFCDPPPSDSSCFVTKCGSAVAVPTPADNSVTAAKTDISIVQGDVIYGNGTDSWTRLAKGTAGQVLKMNSGATAPEWATDANDNTQLSTEQVQDIAGPLIATGGTKTGITITYQDADGDMDFVVNDTTKLPLAGGTMTGVATFNAAAIGEVTALSDGATIATDLALSNNFSVTLAGNRTLGQPTNQVAGQSGSIFVTQDGTGSRTLAYHADFKWAGGTAPTLTTTAAAVDRIDYVVAAANKIHAVASLDVK